MTTEVRLSSSTSLNGAHPVGILYPAEDGEPMPGKPPQKIVMTDCYSILRVRYQDNPRVYVGMDQFVYYVEGTPSRRLAPNIYVAVETDFTDADHPWLTWVHGGAPDFVLEFAAESTVERDRGEKRDLYAEIGVREYWRYDPTGDTMYPERLIGERLDNGQWEPIPVVPDLPGGMLRGRSEVLELDLCVRLDIDTEPHNQLRFFDRRTRDWLRNLSRAEDERAAAEDARAAAERENRQLRERLAELGVTLD